MSLDRSETLARAYEYALRQRKKLTESRLGSGQDGIVLQTESRTAIKALNHLDQCERERNAYWRLQNREIQSVAGFNVPKLIHWSDSLMVIEMSVVKPPFVVDFAGAWLDGPSPSVSEKPLEWQEHVKELFDTAERWERVREVISGFRRIGIYLSDVKPGNIMFGDEDLLE